MLLSVLRPISSATCFDVLLMRVVQSASRVSVAKAGTREHGLAG